MDYWIIGLLDYWIIDADDEEAEKLDATCDNRDELWQDNAATSSFSTFVVRDKAAKAKT